MEEEKIFHLIHTGILAYWQTINQYLDFFIRYKLLLQKKFSDTLFYWENFKNEAQLF